MGLISNRHWKLSTDIASDSSELSDGVVDDSSATPPKKRALNRRTIALLAAIFVLGAGLVVRYQSGDSESQLPGTMQGAAQELVETNPDDPVAWFTKGALQQIQERDLEGAIESYSRALELDPGYVTALFNRGFAYKDLGRLEEARLDFAQIVIIKNGQAPLALLNVGLVYIEQGDQELGEGFLQRAYEQDPTLRP